MPFETTIWNVLSNASRDSESAAQQIVRRYRAPIMKYIRQRGFSLEDAEDLAQEVLADVCCSDFLEAADRRKGRFRNLVLAVVRHKISSHLRRQFAQKRGGGAAPVPIDAPSGEEGHVVDVLAAQEIQPDTEFDRLWLLNLVQEAAQELGAESPHLGRVFALFYDEGLSYDQVAQRIRKSKSDVTNYLSDARRRVRRKIRRMIEGYVSSYEEFHDEIAYLLKNL